MDDSDCSGNSVNSWELGSCIPVGILSAGGLLHKCQYHLEEIRVICDHTCPGQGDHMPSQLIAFPRLRTLSWAGVRSMSQLDELCTAIGARAQQLAELDLDWSNQSPSTLTSSAATVDHVVSFKVLLTLPHLVSPLYLVRLRVLSPSNISLETGVQDVASAFNFQGHAHFEAPGLSGVGGVPGGSWAEGRDPGLKTLEIVSNLHCNSSFDPDASIATFLRRFRGLQELQISTIAMSPCVKLWAAVAGHRHTLGSFVHHRRDIDYTGLELGPDLQRDSTDLGLYPEHRSALAVNPAMNPVSRLDCPLLGLCCHPELLKPILLVTKTSPSLRVLHIRQSGSDLWRWPSWGVSSSRRGYSKGGIAKGLLNSTPGFSSSPRWQATQDDGATPAGITTALHAFAQWAFGPTGIESLQTILAQRPVLGYKRVPV
ncbi:hypothetical protein BDW66DRAFT_151355 [Aspergillus desertorum]